MAGSSERHESRATTRAQTAKISPREIPQSELPPPLEQFQATRPNGADMTYPGFGWEGYCVDRSISTDSPDAMKWCHEQGLINHTSKTLYNTPLLKFCRERAPKCADVLAKLGYPSDFDIRR